MRSGRWYYGALLIVVIGLAVTPSPARTAARRDDAAFARGSRNAASATVGRGSSATGRLQQR